MTGEVVYVGKVSKDPFVSGGRVSDDSGGVRLISFGPRSPKRTPGFRTFVG